MHKLAIGLMVAVFVVSALAYRSTRGYYKPSTGRYVAPYYSSTPNRSKADNWSSRGNSNPFTGKRGYKSWY